MAPKLLSYDLLKAKNLLAFRVVATVYEKSQQHAFDLYLQAFKEYDQIWFN